MKNPSFRYSLKVWLSSVFVAPLIYIIAVWCFSSNNYDPKPEFELYPIFIFFELIFSFVTWLIFWLIIELAKPYAENNTRKKWLIFTAGIVLTTCNFLPFMLPLDHTLYSNMFFHLMLSNCFCIGGGSLFFKLGAVGVTDLMLEEVMCEGQQLGEI